MKSAPAAYETEESDMERHCKKMYKKVSIKLIDL
jgi:hypothetical protein